MARGENKNEGKQARRAAIAQRSSGAQARLSTEIVNEPFLTPVNRYWGLKSVPARLSQAMIRPDLLPYQDREFVDWVAAHVSELPGEQYDAISWYTGVGYEIANMAFRHGIGPEDGCKDCLGGGVKHSAPLLASFHPAPRAFKLWRGATLTQDALDHGAFVDLAPVSASTQRSVAKKFCDRFHHWNKAREGAFPAAAKPVLWNIEVPEGAPVCFASEIIRRQDGSSPSAVGEEAEILLGPGAHFEIISKREFKAYTLVRLRASWPELDDTELHRATSTTPLAPCFVGDCSFSHSEADSCGQSQERKWLRPHAQCNCPGSRSFRRRLARAEGIRAARDKVSDGQISLI